MFLLVNTLTCKTLRTVSKKGIKNSKSSLKWGFLKIVLNKFPHYFLKWSPGTDQQTNLLSKDPRLVQKINIIPILSFLFFSIFSFLFCFFLSFFTLSRFSFCFFSSAAVMEYWVLGGTPRKPLQFAEPHLHCFFSFPGRNNKNSHFY